MLARDFLAFLSSAVYSRGQISVDPMQSTLLPTSHRPPAIETRVIVHSRHIAQANVEHMDLSPVPAVGVGSRWRVRDLAALFAAPGLFCLYHMETAGTQQVWRL